MPHKDPEQRKASQAAYRAARREELAAKQRAYHARTREERKKTNRAYVEARPMMKRAKRLVDGSNKRAALWSESPDRLLVSELLRRMPLTDCTYCGAEATTWDHVVPLCAAGPNTVENLTLTCYPCNRSKGRKHLWVLHEPPPSTVIWWQPPDVDRTVAVLADWGVQTMRGAA